MQRLLALLPIILVLVSCTSGPTGGHVAVVTNSDEQKVARIEPYTVQIMNTYTGEVENIDDINRIQPRLNDTLLIRDFSMLTSDGLVITNKSIYGYFIGHVPENMVEDSLTYEYYKAVVLKYKLK